MTVGQNAGTSLAATSQATFASSCLCVVIVVEAGVAGWAVKNVILVAKSTRVSNAGY